jgi:magnesium chelatase family protein
MIGKTYTYSRMGMNCNIVEVEVDLKNGLPVILVTGLLSQEVKESKDRIRPAVLNSGFSFPSKRITINLSPAEIIKSGTHYDLAIAIALLKADGVIEENTCKTVYFGELNLSGEIRWIRGILPMVTEAINQGFEKIFIPKDNYPEIIFLQKDNIFPVESLNDLINNFNDDKYSDFIEIKSCQEEPQYGDYSNIKGQKDMVDAFKIAASGNHHMLLIGPPGSGKTMGASRLPTIMPSLIKDEIMDINKIYSIASFGSSPNWVTERPFRTPHNSSSSRAVIGGGAKILPGEISLAHKGILFLDEFLEFHSDTLQALRTVIEKKEVFISLRNGCAVYPADFLMVAASNPCSCGFFDTKGGICGCSLSEIKRYRKKLKNPLTDRIDLQVKVERINYSDLVCGEQNQSSAEIRKEVIISREIQIQRYSREKFRLNSEIPPEKISYYCTMEKEGNKIIERFMEENLLTARACHKILRIARTIADLEVSNLIKIIHLEKALKYRFLDYEAY